MCVRARREFFKLLTANKTIEIPRNVCVWSARLPSRSRRNDRSHSTFCRLKIAISQQIYGSRGACESVFVRGCCDWALACGGQFAPRIVEHEREHWASYQLLPKTLCHILAARIGAKNSLRSLDDRFAHPNTHVARHTSKQQSIFTAC